MNDFAKMAWATTLLILGYLAAAWLGPPSAATTARQAPPAGWSTHQLTPVDESNLAGVNPTQALVPTDAASLQFENAAPPYSSISGNRPLADEIPALRRDPGPLAVTSQPAAGTNDAENDQWWLSAAVSRAPSFTPPMPSAGAMANTPREPAHWSDPNATSIAQLPPRTPTFDDEWPREPAVAPPALLSSDENAAQLAATPPPRTLSPIATAPGTNAFALNGGDDWRAGEPRIHVVADGDSLPRLAQRYLGSSDRAEEIYAANRGVLNSPRLLPIGVELTIPDGSQVSVFAANPTAPPRARLQPPVSVHTGYAPSQK